MKRPARILLPLVLGAALLAPVTGSADAATSHAHARAHQSRATTIARARTWLTAIRGHRVPYSQTKYFGGYRTDCSGYVAMALHLPMRDAHKSEVNTIALATRKYSHRITMAQLQMGDLVIDATGDSKHRHVVIFEKWANPAHTVYWVYEQRGGHGTSHDTHSYGVGRDQYDPYRPNVY